MRGRYGSEFYAFSDYDSFSLIEKRKSQILSAINSQPDNYILNVNKIEYIEGLVSEFVIPPIEIHRDQLTVLPCEAQIPAEIHPNSYNVYPGKSYKRVVIKYRNYALDKAEIYDII